MGEGKAVAFSSLLFSPFFASSFSKARGKLIRQDGISSLEREGEASLDSRAACRREEEQRRKRRRFRLFAPEIYLFSIQERERQRDRDTGLRGEGRQTGRSLGPRSIWWRHPPTDWVTPQPCTRMSCDCDLCLCVYACVCVCVREREPHCWAITRGHLPMFILACQRTNVTA